MNEAIQAMLERYKSQSAGDYENALKEIFQEIVLLGLWRAKFFEKAAFYGGTALRILYGLDRFSEDLDFSLLNSDLFFSLTKYNSAVQAELRSFGFENSVETISKSRKSRIQSAFIKAGTQLQMIHIGVPEKVFQHVPRNRMIKIRFEVDTDPPGRFQTEARTLLQPIPFRINTFTAPDLFAGKVHAVLCRNWKSRVKGRDWYDLVWYIGHQIPLRLVHLKKRLIQTQNWKLLDELSGEVVMQLLNQQIEKVDFQTAKNEVLPFLKDPESVRLWSRSFFQEVVLQLQFT